MGGVAAVIPNRGQPQPRSSPTAVSPNRREPEVTQQAFDKVRADKTREANDGFDGFWVAHPDLVPICREVFDSVLGDRPNQIDRQRDDLKVSAAELLDVTSARGRTTEAGLRSNLQVAMSYVAVWPSENGEVGENAFASFDDPASRLIADICLSEEYTEILTQPAYELLIR